VTFSDQRVVDLVRSRFHAVWESVAPVSIAVFDLGGGKSVRGTMGGEIALYFCRPDGKVFDVLPALHSPHVTYWAVLDALEFFDRTGATYEAIAKFHREKLAEMDAEKKGFPSEETRKWKARLRTKRSSADAGTRALGELTLSKSGFVDPEPIVVIEPGGLLLYRRGVHEALSSSPPKTPQEWKETVFVKILEQELKGGEFRYDVDTLAPISVIEED
jgi:hypothetical protein